MSLECFSYEAQLGYVKKLIEMAQSGGEKVMLLSLAESIKKARRHDLDCSEDSFKAGYQKGLSDAATVVEITDVSKFSPIFWDRHNIYMELRHNLAEGIRLFSKSDVPPQRFLYTVR